MMSARGVGVTLKGIERALTQYEKVLDLSDSWYILIAPTSLNFHLLSKILSSEVRMIISSIFINDGSEGDGFREFRDRLTFINGKDHVIEEIFEKIDQIEIISRFSELSSFIREYKSGELGLRALIVCSGPYKLDLFHLSLYLDARAIELTEEGFRELISYPTWKLNEVSLSILYVAMKLEAMGERVTPHSLARYVKLKEKGERRDIRSKVVSLDYHIKKYLEREGLLQKERDPESKRGVSYKLTKKGVDVARLVEAHFKSQGLRIEDYVDLSSLNQSVEVDVSS